MMHYRNPDKHPKMALIKAIHAIFVCAFISGLAATLWAGQHLLDKGVVIAGSGLARSSGDYISCNAVPAGLNTYYSIWIEVPAGVSQLGISIFDADIGGYLDEQYGGAWDTSVRYSLRDPSGTETCYLTIGNDLSADFVENKELFTFSPEAGHWELRVDMSNAVTTGDDVNYFEIRAFARKREFLESFDGADPGWTPQSWWDLGAPAGKSGDPSKAYSGTNVFGYNNGGHDGDLDLVNDGLYQNSMGAADLSSTNYDCSAFFDVQVSFWRWLGVEQSSADQAVFSVFDGSSYVTIWSNPDTLIQDSAWTRMTFDISNKGLNTEQLSLIWTMGGTNATGQYCGWNIDDVELWVYDSSFDLNMYFDSFMAHRHFDYTYIGDPYSVGPDFTIYPYVTCGCSGDTNDFDSDNDATITLATRTSQTPSFSPTVSGNDAWSCNAFSGWTSDTTSGDYGIWSATLTLDELDSSGDIMTFYMAHFDADTTAPPPTAQPENGSIRLYLSAGEDPYSSTPPLKPHVTQAISEVSTGDPPVDQGDTYLEITITVDNPTNYAITFDTQRLVRAYVPGTTAAGDIVFLNIDIADDEDPPPPNPSQGTVITQPAIGGSGWIEWNPGALSAGSTATMRYWVRATPSGTGRLPVTGTPAANGTTAKFVDETGNTIQTRATFTFGPLCELAITPGVSLSGGGVPTRALVGGMTASRLNDQSIISWSTAGESGTAAFRLARWDPAAGTWRVVNQTPVPALVDAPQGGVYRLADPEALPGQTYQYRIEELDVHGRVLDYGPFTVTIPEPASNPDVVAAPPVDASGSRTPHPRQRRDADTPNVKPEHFKTAVAGKTAAGGTRPEAAKVAVRADGLHAVTFDALAEALALPRAAVEALAHRGRLEITSGGRLVTYLTDLAPGAIVFYGRRLDSPYADANVYRVAVGRGRLMARADGAPPAAVAPGLTFATTQDAEEDHLPAPAVTRNPESDYWFWDYLFADHPTQGAKTFTVPTPAPAGTGAAALAVRLHGGTDTGFGTDHQVAVRLNGVNVGTARWDGLTAHSLRFTIDPAILRDGANTVELAAQLNEGIPYSLVYVDGFAVDYVRQARADTDRLRLAPGGLAPHAVAVDGFTTDAIVVLDITDPDAPVLQPAAAERAGRNWRVCFRCQPRHEYFAASVGTAAAVTAVSPDWPSRLRDTEPGADYVVITPQSLLGPAEALAAYRASQGHRALVVDIADIYDEFNHGRSSPQAIRDFLAWAVAHWSVPPRFVVLAGRGTYDYRDLEGFGDNLLPPLYLGTTHGLAAADNRFACVAGDDNVPDLAVGRLPAATAAELQAMVDKIIAYEAQPDGAWSRRALVVADNPDPAGDFPADSETVAAELPPWLRLRRISLAEQTALEAREALVSGIATGAGLVNYLGHGGVDRLAAEGVLRLDDIPSLANGARLPLVLAFTCAAGECTIPGYPGLGEALLARPAGGAIAVYAPAGLSDNTAAVELNAALAAELGRGHAMLGDAIRAALAAWEPADPAAGYHRDLYILLGDPALRLVR